MGRVCAVLAVVLAVLGLTSPARAQGIDQTCLLVLTEFDAATVNVAFPDDSARYWGGAYAAIPGTRIRLTGRFPHSRYMSFNAYDPTLRPVDGLADVEITPDPGHVNPFLPGADRTAQNRSYTAFIEYGPKPAQPAPNTLYTGTAPDGTVGTFLYRLYVPDRGRSETGDVGLPTATIEATGAQPSDRSVCSDLAKPKLQGLNELLAAQEGSPSGGTLPPLFDRPVPKWRKFTNMIASVADSLTDSDLLDPLFQAQRSLDLQTLGGSGGFLSNVDNAYLSAGINKAHGAVVVTSFRPPTFPDTRPGPPVMPSGQLRYWSVCSNDPLTQRFMGCLNDDRAVLRPDGKALFVVSTPAHRPANARAACGVNWLPWGPNARNVLIYRHMLPSPGFTASIQAATFEREAETMGDGFPVSAYTSKLLFELRGCPAA